MPPLPDNDTDVYIVIEDFGASGRSYLETDLAHADRDTTVRNFISGQYEDALKVAVKVTEALEGGNDLKPYRSFWYELASQAAFHALSLIHI